MAFVVSLVNGWTRQYVVECFLRPHLFLIRTVFEACKSVCKLGGTNLVNGAFGAASFSRVWVTDAERGVGAGLSSFWRL